MIRRVSKSRAKQMREYAKLKRAHFEAHPHCFMCGEFLEYDSRELHHWAGRIGRLLTWTPGFRTVGAYCHKWIELNREEAFAKGYLCPRGMWNDYERAVNYQNAIKTHELNSSKQRPAVDGDRGNAPVPAGLPAAR